MGLVLLEGPAAPVATLEEAQAQTRSDNAQEAALLAALVAAATAQAESFCRRRFVTQRWRLTLDQFPAGGAPFLSAPWCALPVPPLVPRPRQSPAARRAIVVPHPPLVSVETLTYVDPDGDVLTMDAADYVVRAAESPGEIVPAYAKSWPATRGVPDAVQVEFTCGYGAPDAVPAAVKQAVLLIVGTLYANRETVAPVAMSEIPHSAEWLLGPYRVVRFAA